MPFDNKSSHVDMAHLSTGRVLARTEEVTAVAARSGDTSSDLARLRSGASPHRARVINIDGLFAAGEGEQLSLAAARLVVNGVPVFPCVPVGKRPLTSHGFLDATTDVREAARWWRRWPSANIGVPTGAASGVDVVDVDLKVGGSGYAAFMRARRAGLADGWLALVRTPSGGMHVFYPTALDRPQPSWQAASACVDFRGDGGYVIVAPSVGVAADGTRAAYTVVGRHRPVPSPVDAQALRQLLEPLSGRTLARAPALDGHRDVGRLALWVAGLAEGERNRGLFWAGCRLAEAGLLLAEAEAALAPGARRAGLPDREIASTIRSAYRIAGGEPGRSSLSAGTEPICHRLQAERRVLS